MSMKQIKSFKVVNYNFNHNEVEYYDVIPYFVDILDTLKRSRTKYNKYIHKPRNREEVVDFVQRNGHSMFWSRCQWEVIVSSWPPQYFRDEFNDWILKLDKNNPGDVPDFRKGDIKIDVWDQIEANLDLVVDILCEYLKIKK